MKAFELTAEPGAASLALTALPGRCGVRSRELARSLGVAPSVIYTAVARGELPSFRLAKNDRAISVPVEAIDERLATELGVLNAKP